MSFDAVLKEVDAMHAAGTALGGEAAAAVAAFKTGTVEMKKFVDAAAKAAKPADMAQIQAMLKPVSDQMAAIDKLLSKRGKFDMHCKMLNEAAQAFAWVVEAKPFSYINDCCGAAMFSGNKVLMANKGGDKSHSVCVLSMQEALKALAAYVKATHAAGLTWNAGGGAAASSNGNVAVAAAGTGGLAAVQKEADAAAAAGAKLGDDAKVAGAEFAASVKAHVAFIQQAMSSPKPADVAQIQAMLKPVSDHMATIDKLLSKRGKFDMHCKAVNEAAQAFSWVFEGKPFSYVNDCCSAAMFSGNKVLMANKGGDASHAGFINAVQAALKELSAYIKGTHPAGLAWNTAKGGAAVLACSAAPAPAAAAGGATGWAAVTASNQDFTRAAQALGGEAKEAAAAFGGALGAHAEFLNKAAAMAKPGDLAKLQAMLKPVNHQMVAIDKLAAKRSTMEQHCKMVNEAAHAFAWVLETKTAGFVSETSGAAMFIGNKILMAHKGGDANHATFVKALQGTLKALMNFVKDAHPAGLAWGGGKTVSPPAGAQATATGADALVAELASRGNNAAAGLRKVDDSEKRHKQPRGEPVAVSAAGTKAKAPPSAKSSASWVPPTGTAVTKLESKKWAVQYHNAAGADQPVVVDLDEGVEAKHVVFIFRCNNALINIKRKVNTVMMVECFKTQVCVSGTIGPVELTRCRGAEVLLREPSATVIFGATHGAVVHLGKDDPAMLQCDFVFSGSTGLNVTAYAPDGEGGRTTVEVPLPDQFESVVGNDKNLTLSTTAVVHSG